MCHQHRNNRALSSVYSSRASPFSFFASPNPFSLYPSFAVSYACIYIHLPTHPPIHPPFCPSVHLSSHPEIDLQTLLCGEKVAIQLLPRWRLLGATIAPKLGFLSVPLEKEQGWETEGQVPLRPAEKNTHLQGGAGLVKTAWLTFSTFSAVS